MNKYAISWLFFLINASPVFIVGMHTDVSEPRAHKRARKAQEHELLSLAQWGHRTCLQEYLTHTTATINTQDSLGETALIKAIKGGHLGCVQLLLDQKNINPNIQDNLGKSALIHAMENDNYTSENIIRALIRHEDLNPNLQDIKGHTALSYALQTLQKKLGYVEDHATRHWFSGQSDTSDPEYDGGSDEDDNEPNQAQKNFYFQMKALLKKFNTVRIDKRTDINISDFKGRTPLIRALQLGYTPFVQALCNDSRIQYTTYGGTYNSTLTPLMMVAAGMVDHVHHWRRSAKKNVKALLAHDIDEFTKQKELAADTTSKKSPYIPKLKVPNINLGITERIAASILEKATVLHILGDDSDGE